MMRVANRLAVDNWMISSDSPAKFDFWSQPAAEELSVWLQMQSSSDMSEERISIHMVITQAINSKAINSKEFIDARKRKFNGSSQRHAYPEIGLYPPIPNSHASDLNMCVGRRYVMLLKDTPD